MTFNGARTFVAIIIFERSSGRLTNQLPMMDSERPNMYTSAVSIKLPPA